MTIPSPSPGGIIAIASVFFVLQAAAVAVRFLSRWKDKKSYGADDYCALAASIAYTAIFTVPVIIGAADAGLGRRSPISPVTHMPEVPSKTFDKIQFIFLTFHVIVLGLARCSILLLYRRIFVGKTFRIIIWALIVYTVAWTISFFFAFLFKCSPVTTDTLPPPGTKCIDLVVLTKALGITSALSDFFILLIPWPLVYKLQMNLTMKLALSFVFMLGSLTLAASIVRCVVLFQIDAELSSGAFPDFPYFDGVNIVWALLESTMAIVCSCLPTQGRYLWRSLPNQLRSLTSRLRQLLSSYGSGKTSSARSDSHSDDIKLGPISENSFENSRDPKVTQDSGFSSYGFIEVQHDYEVTNHSVTNDNRV